MTQIRLAVIIPSSLKSSQLYLLDQSITSLRTQSFTLPVKIFVVSQNAPLAVLKKQHRGVTYVQSAHGSGFGEMNNIVLERVYQDKKVDWVLLLNDDAYLRDDFFAQLAKTLSTLSKDIDLLAPLVLSAKDTQRIDNYGVEYFRSGYAKNNHQFNVKTTLASAGCLLVRRTFLEKMKQEYGFFFNPLYYYYLEDVDFVIRAAMIGGKVVRENQLVAYHYGSSSSGGYKNEFSLFHTYRNTIWVMLCCWPVGNILRNIPNILLVQAWVFLVCSVKHRPHVYLKVLVQTARNWPLLMNYRKLTCAAYTGFAAEDRLNTLLSQYSFRTYHGKTIPAL